MLIDDVDTQAVPDRYKPAYTKCLQGKVPRSKAIALKCYDCCGWQRKQPGLDGDTIDMVRECTARGCPLWAYRPGSKLGKSRKLSKEQIAKMQAGRQGG